MSSQRIISEDVENKNNPRRTDGSRKMQVLWLFEISILGSNEGIMSPNRKTEREIYREATGKCKSCGHDLKIHPKCEGCGILTGINHTYGLSRFRNHNICGGCIVRWKNRDTQLSKEATWEEFLGTKHSFRKILDTTERIL